MLPVIIRVAVVISAKSPYFESLGAWYAFLFGNSEEEFIK